MDYTEKTLLAIVSGVGIYWFFFRRPAIKVRIQPTILEKRVMLYGGLIWNEGVRQGVEPALIAAVMAAESSGREVPARYLENVNDYVVGLMQVRMATASRVCGVASQEELSQPGINIACGTKYLRDMLDRFGESVTLAISTYNTGPGLLYSVPGRPITNPLYVSAVVGRIPRFRLLFRSRYPTYNRLFPASAWRIE